MPDPSDPKREAILAAALIQFSRYGFRRTSMADIAKQTGSSRASLYSYFENKEQIFCNLSAVLHEQSLAKAESSLKEAASGHSIASCIEGAILGRFASFHEVVSQSAHGAEIYDENNRLCGELVVSSSARFREMLTKALSAAARAGEIDLRSAGLTAPSAAELIHLSATGLKQHAPDVETLENRVRSFVRVFFAGLAS